MSKEIYIDLTPVAWALAIAAIFVALFWGATNSDTQSAKKYETCVQYHTPKECSDATN